MNIKHMCIKIMILLFPFMAGLEAAGAQESKLQPREIPLIQQAPKINGKLDDPAWKLAAKFQGFKTFKPDYGKPGSEETIFYVCSDRENFYVAARCFQKNPSTLKAGMTRRDNIFDDEWIAFSIDTFSDRQNAYAFLVNPFGIQGDGMLDANANLDSSHDMVWYSKGLIDDQGYTVEIKIPFKSFRFPVHKATQMRMWLARNIVATSENLSYPELFPAKGASLSQWQPIIVKNMKYSRTVELLPAISYSDLRAHEEGSWGDADRQLDVSLTGKLGITPSLTLDATYNPDFSQVESDAGQVDFNRRYAIFYSEKRPFFLEGMEEFRFAGNTEDAPLRSVVHTRTINNPSLGVKLTGKLGQKNSLATILAIDEPFNVENGSKAYFGILRYRRILTNDSYIGGFYTGREISKGYNRVAGVDGRFRISSASKLGFHFLGSSTKTADNESGFGGHALAANYDFNNRNISFEVGVQDISENFQVDSGFISRTNITRLAAFGMYRFYPKSKLIQRIEPFYWSYHLRDKESGLWETFNLFTFRLQMARSASFRVDFMLGNEVYAGRRFDNSGVGIQTWGQVTKHLNLSLFFRHSGGTYYDPDNPFPGTENNVSFSAIYQPLEKLTTSLDVAYSDFYRKSDKKKEFDYTLIRSRTTYQVNKYLFFRGIFEYNFFYDRLQVDALASFTYIPGTVVHIGYGTAREKTRWDQQKMEYVPAANYLEIRRAFFFKVSYLWRL